MCFVNKCRIESCWVARVAGLRLLSLSTTSRPWCRPLYAYVVASHTAVPVYSVYKFTFFNPLWSLIVCTMNSLYACHGVWTVESTVDYEVPWLLYVHSRPELGISRPIGDLFHSMCTARDAEDELAVALAAQYDVAKHHQKCRKDWQKMLWDMMTFRMARNSQYYYDCLWVWYVLL